MRPLYPRLPLPLSFILLALVPGLLFAGKSEPEKKFSGLLTNVVTTRVNAEMIGWPAFTSTPPGEEPTFYKSVTLSGHYKYDERYNQYPCSAGPSDLLIFRQTDATITGASTLTVIPVAYGETVPSLESFNIGIRAYSPTTTVSIADNIATCPPEDISDSATVDNDADIAAWAATVIGPTVRRWNQPDQYTLNINAGWTDASTSTARVCTFEDFLESYGNVCSSVSYCTADWNLLFEDDASVTLSAPDTEAAALDTNPDSDRAWTQIITYTDPLWLKTLRTRRDSREFFEQKTTVDAKFWICPGKYEIRMRLMKENYSVSEPPTYEEVSQIVEFTEENRQPDGSFLVPDLVIGPVDKNGEAESLEENEGYKYSATTAFPDEPLLGEVVAVAIEGDCARACSLPAGNGKVGLGCVDVRLSMGSGLDGRSDTILRLEAESIETGINSPNALKVISGGTLSARRLSVGGTLRQVIASDVIVDILTVSGGYELDFYWMSQADPGATPADPLTFVGEDPFAVWTITRPADSGDERYLLVTKGEGGGALDYLFTQDTGGTPGIDDDTWELDEDGARTTSKVSGDAPGDDRYVTTTLSDPTYGTAVVRRVRLHTYTWGDSIVEETLDPDGLHPLTTSYTYHESGDGIGLRHTTTHPDGTVETQTYTDETSPLGGTLAVPLEHTLAYPGGRTRVTLHGTLTDQAVDSGTTDENLVTTTETLGSDVVRRSWELTFSGTTTFAGVSWQESRSIQGISSAAEWGTPGNLVTITRQRETSEGKLQLVHAPDGTLSRTLYGLPNGSGFTTITHERGEAGSSGTTVVAGTRTLEVYDDQHRLVSRTIEDIDSGLTMDEEVMEEFDEWGRPALITYLDGSEEIRTYSSCCGKLESSTRHGVTTGYGYDPLGRWQTSTRSGVTTRETFDAAGRVRLTERYPAATPGSAMTLSTATYDPAGRLTASTDGEGRITTRTETVNPSTGVTTVTTALPYDAAWPTADRGTRIETRRADGLTLAVTGTAVAPVRYEYGTATLSDAAQWGYGGADKFAFTREIKLNGPAASYSDSGEVVTTYSDFFGRPIKTLHADGAAARSFYNALGQLVRQTDPTGVQTLYEYDALGERITTALDAATLGTINYDGTDRITRTKTVATTRDTTPVRRTTTEVWTAADTGSLAGTLVSQQDASLDGLETWQETYGQVTHTAIAYNATTGTRTETSTAPDTTQTVRVYVDDLLKSETRKDPSGTAVAETAYGYDDYGRLQIVSSLQSPGSSLPAANSDLVTTYTYHDDDQIESVRTPDPGAGYDAQITYYHYDDAGRLDIVTLPDDTPTKPSKAYTSYWPTGKVKRTWGSRTYPSEYSYDPQGRVKTLTTWKDFAGTAGAAVTTWNYHAQRGWLSSKRYADNTGPDYTYDAAGRLKTRTWARTLPGTSTRLVTTYNYGSASGDLTGVDYADGTPDVSISAYDRLGRPTTVTDASGTRTLTYENGRLDDESWSGGLLAGRAITRSPQDIGGSSNPYSVDRPGTLEATDIDPISFEYDSLGRLWMVTQGDRVATLAYKPLVGTLQSVTTTAQFWTERVKWLRGTDQLGRIATVDVHLNAASSPAMNRTYTYNTANQRTQVEHEGSRRWAYGYGDLGQVETAQKQHYASSAWSALPGYDYAFAFDDIGNRESATTNGRLNSYTSDALNRYLARGTSLLADVRGSAAATATVLVNDELATRTGEDFYLGVPVLGLKENVLKIQAATASPNRAVTENRSVLVPAVPESFVYDADGNLLKDGLWNYEWDAENRLIAQELRSDVSTATWKRLEYKYDREGRRVQKLVKTRSTVGGSWTTASDTRFLYDGWNLIAEYSYTGSTFTLLRSHVWGLDLSGTPQGAGGVGGLLWTTVAATSKTYIAAADANGNVIAYVDSADGIVAGKRDYGAFGEAVITTGVAGSLPFGFSSKYEEKESGLYYYGYRFYNPSTGRWPNRDPIEEEGGVNLYSFVRNNPVSYTDFLGMALTPYRGYPQWKYAPLKSTRKKIGGETEMLWPPTIAKAPVAQSGGWYVKLEGELSGEIRILPGLDVTRRYGASNQTIIEHEHGHVDLYRRFWGELIEATKNIEGTYCKKECAEVAQFAADVLSQLGYANVMIENNRFDFREYGYLRSDYDYEGEIARYQSAASQLDAKLREYENFWRENKCSKNK